MKIRSSVDIRLPYSAPFAEPFTLTAEGQSLLVSFSASIDFDEEFAGFSFMIEDNPPL